MPQSLNPQTVHACTVPTASIDDPAVTTDDTPSPKGNVLQTTFSDRYQLGPEIARGGMGIVFEAEDAVLNREVAVKVLQDKYEADSGTARRFFDEARITAQLQHPGIPPVHDLGTFPDGRPFLAMKLIKGETLEALLNRRTDPSVERGRYVAAFEQICHALAYAHAHKIIHRDLKPANVMVGSFGEVQVMDWGLAKVLLKRPETLSETDETTDGTPILGQRNSSGSFTQAGSVLGTPAFMPPEQAVGAVGKIDERSDVFGLGAILAVVLTGKSPYAGGSAETIRVQAAQGKIEDCFARLDACGAEPELVSLCKRCLAPERAERPANAGEVAMVIARLRAESDERARQAELDRVRVEGEKAADAARSAERRKRRRVWIGAAAALALAAVAGLGAVLEVQRRANRDLEAKNAELANEQATVKARNRELADEQVKVEARFELAVKAIETFHTGVSRDTLLRNEQFAALRTKLLGEAAGFYGQLEKLLVGQTDEKSLKALAGNYHQLALLTDKIGSRPEALATYRKSMAILQKLIEAHPTNTDYQRALAGSHTNIGYVLRDTGGKSAEVLAAYRESLAIRQKLVDTHPDDAIFLADLANIHVEQGALFSQTGKPTEALEEYAKAVAIQQKLVDAHPDMAKYRHDLARNHNNIGMLLSQTGKPDEAMVSYREAQEIWRKLTEAEPESDVFQIALTASHSNISLLLSRMGKPVEAMAAAQAALILQQKLADKNPAVTQYQNSLAISYNNMGGLLYKAGKRGEAVESCRKALAIQQKLVDANPTVTAFQSDLAGSHVNIGLLLKQMGSGYEEVLECYRKALTIRQKLVDANPGVTSFQSDLGGSYFSIGSLLSQPAKKAEAVDAYRKALAIQRKLADANPSVTAFQSDLARTYNNLAVDLKDTGSATEALEAYRMAKDIRQKLVDANPTVPTFQRDLARSHNNIGVMLKEMGAKPAEIMDSLQKGLVIRGKLADANTGSAAFEGELANSLNNIGWQYATQKQYAEALTHLDRSVNICGKLVSKDKNAANSGLLAFSHAYRGRARNRAGQFPGAVTDLRRAIELWSGEISPATEAVFERARSLAVLANLAAKSTPGVNADEAKPFADQAVAALKQAIESGSSELAILKETEFDAIRDRGDFSALVELLKKRNTKPAEAAPLPREAK